MNKKYLLCIISALLGFAGCGDGEDSSFHGPQLNSNRLPPDRYTQSALSIPNALDDQFLLTQAAWFGAGALSYLWSYGDLNVFNQYAGLQLPHDELIVAVIDTGIDKDHPDIAGRLWLNPVEGLDGNYNNGADDDHDGYTDDFIGWDFVHNSNNPADDAGHGSHVAGTIGAVGGNGAGIVGLAPWVRLMALKVCDSNGSCDTSDIRAAMSFAVQHGAKIINLSLGAADQGAESAAFDQAIAAATAAGTLVFAAAGNAAGDAELIAPANATMAVAVSAYRNDGALCSFSNTGWKVDLGGPGCGFNGTSEVAGILSLNSRKCGPRGDQLCSRSAGGADYTLKSGTSMSTPHAVGMAAVAWTASPDATPLMIRQALLRTARKPQAGSVSSTLGMGKLSGTNIIDEARTAPGIKIVSPRYGTTANSQTIGFRIEARASTVSWSLRYVANPTGTDVDLSSGVPIASSVTDVGAGSYVTLSQAWTPPATGSYLVILEADSNGRKYYDVTLLRR